MRIALVLFIVFIILSGCGNNFGIDEGFHLFSIAVNIDNENSAGAVYVDGKTWTARSTDDTVIEAGTRVCIERMEGVKLYVRKAPVPVA